MTINNNTTEEPEDGNPLHGFIMLIGTVCIICFWGGCSQASILDKIIPSNIPGVVAPLSKEEIYDSYRILANKIRANGPSSLSEHDRLKAVELDFYLKQDRYGRSTDDERFAFITYSPYGCLASAKNLNGTFSLRRWMNAFVSRGKAVMVNYGWYISIPVGFITYLISLLMLPFVWITDILIYFNPLAIIGSVADIFLEAFRMIAGAFGYYG